MRSHTIITIAILFLFLGFGKATWLDTLGNVDCYVKGTREKALS